MTTKQLTEPGEVLYRLKRGLSGYLSYLAACEMNESFSEYALYEPILRVLSARCYTVRFEVVCPNIDQPRTGDQKRLDLVAEKSEEKSVVKFAMEVKWQKSRALNVTKDRAKLKAFLGANTKARAFLCVFGRKSHIENKSTIENLGIQCWREQGKPVFAEFGRTRYGCRVFELLRNDAC